MEYPFKDLMPFDEVLEREGYYRDWTHLDPEVFYSLTQISNFIKTKGYGVDVRLLIAQLAEHFGLSVVEVTDIANNLIARQDAVEYFNSQVVQEMTYKDIISAPEIIAARGGKPTLQARLDDTTARLAEKAAKTDVVAVNNRIDNTIANAGDGTIPTELIDIRAGKNGKVYDTAHERIDSEITAIKDSVNKIAEEKVIIDDTNNNINYVGSWNLGDGNDYNNSNHSSKTPGDSIEYSFIGTGIGVYDRMNTSRGVVEIFIDGVSQGTFDRYESRTRYSQLAFEKFDLEYGPHIIKIVITEQKNEASTETSFVFDYFAVYNQFVNNLKGKITKNINVSSLKQFKQVAEKSRNLYNHQTSLESYYISRGQLVALNGRSTSDYIEVVPGRRYIKNQRKTAHEASLFDENGNYIMEISASDGVFTVPKDPTIKYLRFFVNTSEMVKRDVMLVEGVTIPTEFIPYSEEKFVLDGLIVGGEQDRLHEREFAPYPYYTKKLNPPRPLFIPTYNDDGDHAIHPKVLYFPEKWNGYKFWMTFTPYTKTNEAIENPSIAVSNNGIDWGIPEGLTNPLDIPVDTARTHNSDPHLVYNHDTDTLECWWRFSTKPSQPSLFERVYRRTTKDGVNWTEKELLSESLDTITGLQSPAVNYEDGKYKIWYSHSINPDRSRRIVKYEESIDGTNWQFVRDIVLAQDDEGPLQVLNHLDVVKVNGVYKMVGSKSYQGSTGLTYMTSTDNVTYTEPVEILKRGHPNSWDGVQCYRPSITVVDGYEYLYYCGRDKNSNWGTGLIVVDDVGNMREYGGLT